MGSSVIKSAL